MEEELIQVSLTSDEAEYLQVALDETKSSLSQAIEVVNKEIESYDATLTSLRNRRSYLMKQLQSVNKVIESMTNETN